MPAFTRKQLRNFTTNSADFSSAQTFTLVNNATTTAYFAIEGGRYYVRESGVFVGHKYKDVFDSASLSSLSNCTVVSGSLNAGFIVDPSATATFTFTPTSTISKDLVLFSAPNAKVISGSTETFYGVDLDIS